MKMVKRHKHTHTFPTIDFLFFSLLLSLSQTHTQNSQGKFLFLFIYLCLCFILYHWLSSPQFVVNGYNVHVSFYFSRIKRTRFNHVIVVQKRHNDDICFISIVYIISYCWTLDTSWFSGVNILWKQNTHEHVYIYRDCFWYLCKQRKIEIKTKKGRIEPKVSYFVFVHSVVATDRFDNNHTKKKKKMHNNQTFPKHKYLLLFEKFSQHK